MAEEFFKQLLVILSFSLVITILFRRLNMTTIIAYMVVGVAIGPLALNFVSNPDDFALLAEFGVVFLLFSLGLEFSLPKMLELKLAVFGLGSFQVIMCTSVFALAVYYWGSTLEESIIIAGALALSSTAIVTKELASRRALSSQSGQLAVGILLFQDLVAVVFLILVPVLAGSGDSLASELIIAGKRALILICLLMAIGKWVLPYLYKEVALADSEEIFVLSTLVIALLAGWLTHSFHLSMALGGFITGMMLGESPFKYQIESDIRPFKDIFLGLFFVTIGMNLDISLLIEYWPRILGFTLLLVLIKAGVVAMVVKALRYRGEDAVKVGITLAQSGEFGLALIALAHINGLIPTDQGSFIILMIFFSMAISPFLIRYAGDFSHLLSGTGRSHKRRKDAVTPLHSYHGNHVIIGGFGRVGLTVAELMEINDIPYIAIDNDIESVIGNRERGKNVVYGDCNKINILNHCHLGEARLAILTFNSLNQARATIAQIRQKHIQLPIIVRCRENSDIQELISLGANHVFPEMLESSLLIAAQVLNFLEIEEHVIEAQINQQRCRLSDQ